MSHPQNTPSKNTPLSRRECGPCQACCRELKIDVPELKKKAGVDCPHLTSAGCGIYETRPPVCRGFLCGWRLFNDLDDSWRPDLSGVLIVKREVSTMPAEYRAAGFGISLVITGGDAAILRPGFAEYVVRLLKKNIGVQMSATSPATLLNHHLDAETAGQDMEETRRSLLRLYGLLKAARWKRGPLILWHLYRLEVARQKALMKRKFK
jgi:hypothetical protein